jgi:membrane protease YdiL (CAAX protease family)
MFRNRYLYSFILIFVYFVLYNGSAFIYTVLSLNARRTPNMLLFDAIAIALLLGIASLYISKANINVIRRDLSSKDIFSLLILVVSLVLYKLLIFNLNTEEVTATAGSNFANDAIALKSIKSLFLGPITEEFVFRAIILYVLLNSKNLLLAICYSALLFLLVHITPYNYSNAIYLSFVLIMGTFYAIIYLRYGIIASILVHIISNAVMFIPIWKETNPINLFIGDLSKVIIAILLILVLAVMGYLFVRIFKEYKSIPLPD